MIGRPTFKGTLGKPYVYREEAPQTTLRIFLIWSALILNRDSFQKTLNCPKSDEYVQIGPSKSDPTKV